MNSFLQAWNLVVWTLVFLAEGALALLLFWRGGWRSNRAFTAFISFCTLRSCLLYCARGSAPLSSAIWWSCYPLQSVLLIALVLEVVQVVFSPFDTLPRGMMRNMILAVASIALLFGTFTILFPGAQPSEWMELLRAMDQGVSCTLWGTFLLIGAFASLLGIPWNHRIFGVVSGFFFYLSVDVVVVTLIAQLGLSATRLIWPIDSLAFLLACYIWLYFFLRDEVPRTVPTMPQVIRIASVLSQYIRVVEAMDQSRPSSSSAQQEPSKTFVRSEPL